MATSKEFHDYVMENLSRAVGDVRSRRMMGEYCLYFRGKLIGLLCDNCFFLKETDASRRLLPDAERSYPYEDSKTLMPVVEELDDLDFLRELLEETFSVLPEPKPKKGVHHAIR